MTKVNPTCSSCDAPATCFGSRDQKFGYGCDDCCNHGHGDGFCEDLGAYDYDEWPERAAYDAGLARADAVTQIARDMLDSWIADARENGDAGVKAELLSDTYLAAFVALRSAL